LAIKRPIARPGSAERFTPLCGYCAGPAGAGTALLAHPRAPIRARLKGGCDALWPPLER
jgi:hypothetical protein